MDGLDKTKTDLFKQEGILTADGFWIQATTLPYVSSLPVYYADIEFIKFPQLCEPIFSFSQKINIYI